jgi:hypothetical protein
MYFPCTSSSIEEIKVNENVFDPMGHQLVENVGKIFGFNMK